MVDGRARGRSGAGAAAGRPETHDGALLGDEGRPGDRAAHAGRARRARPGAPVRRRLARVRRLRQGRDHRRAAARATRRACPRVSGRSCARISTSRARSHAAWPLRRRCCRSGAPCYHALTWGWLAGELVCARRARRGAFVRDAWPSRCGLDLGIGLAAATTLAGGCCGRVRRPGTVCSAFMADEPDPRLTLVYAQPPVRIDPPGATPDLLSIGAPAVNGVATARAMAHALRAARRAAACSPATLALGAASRRVGADALTGRPLRYGPTGYELAGTPSVLGPAADAFGHTGAGGGSHGAWPSLRTGFSFLTADLRSQDGDARAASAARRAPRRGAGMSGAAPEHLVVVMADQLAAAFLPCYGHRGGACPAPDRARALGRRSSRAPTAPRRCARRRARRMLAGRRPSAIGVFDNAAELAASTPTIAHLLRAAGYHTVLAGKMHFVGPDQLHGFEERLTTDVYPAGLRLDARLAPAVGDAPALVPQHVRRARRRGARGGDADGLRRRGVLPGGRADPRARAAAGSAAVLPGRLVHEPARPVGGARPPLGHLRRAARSIRRRCR